MEHIKIYFQGERRSSRHLANLDAYYKRLWANDGLTFKKEYIKRYTQKEYLELIAYETS
ncbi:hypothetical protein KAW65_00245 [candidate division WOR-3 bacterium]|nr:hypothetical protein [candidate division WOR-3 bacterium]